MMYTDVNFKTKKALKEAVKAYHDGTGGAVTFYQPGGFFPTPDVQNGTITVEGPHYPEPHRWYASCKVEHNVIVGVK